MILTPSLQWKSPFLNSDDTLSVSHYHKYYALHICAIKQIRHVGRLALDGRPVTFGTVKFGQGLSSRTTTLL